MRTAAVEEPPLHSIYVHISTLPLYLAAATSLSTATSNRRRRRRRRLPPPPAITATVMEVAAAGKTPVEMESAAGYGRRSPPVNYFSADFSIRLLLFATSLTGLVVLATSKQTERIPTAMAPFFTVRSAQFDHAPGLM